MRVLRLVDGERAVEFHPFVTVVTDLDDGQKRAIIEAFRQSASGRSTELAGLIEAHGVVLDLAPEMLGLLELDHVDVDLLVEAADLPTSESTLLHRRLARARRRLEDLGVPHERVLEAADRALRVADGAHSELELLRSQLEERRSADRSQLLEPIMAESAIAEEQVAALSGPASRAVGAHDEARRRVDDLRREFEGLSAEDRGGSSADADEIAARLAETAGRIDDAAADRLSDAIEALETHDRDTAVAREDALARAAAHAVDDASESTAESAGHDGEAPSEVITPADEHPAEGDDPDLPADLPADVEPAVDSPADEQPADPPEVGERAPADATVGVVPPTDPSLASANGHHSSVAAEAAELLARAREPDAPSPGDAERDEASVVAEYRSVIALHESFDVDRVHAALHELRDAVSTREHVPSPDALHLAAQIEDLERRLVGLDLETPMPSDQEVEVASNRARDLRASYEQVEARLEPSNIDAQMAELDQVHLEIDAMRESTSSRFGRGRSGRDLEALVAREGELLGELGFASYTDYMTGNRAALAHAAVPEELRALRVELDNADATSKALERAMRNHVALETFEVDLAELRQEARRLVAASDPRLTEVDIADEHLPARLQSIRIPADVDEPAQQLSEALLDVGLLIDQSLDVTELEAMASDWLHEYAIANERVDELHRRVAAYDAASDGTVARSHMDAEPGSDNGSAGSISVAVANAAERSGVQAPVVLAEDDGRELDAPRSNGSGGDGDALAPEAGGPDDDGLHEAMPAEPEADLPDAGQPDAVDADDAEPDAVEPASGQPEVVEPVAVEADAVEHEVVEPEFDEAAAAAQRDELVAAVAAAKESFVDDQAARAQAAELESDLAAARADAEAQATSDARRADLEVELTAAVSAADAARAELDRIEAETEQARTEVARLRALADQRAHEAEADIVAAEESLAAAERASKTADADLADARAAVQRSEGDLAAAQTTVDEIATAIAEAPDEDVPVEEIEWYLLSRLASQRQVSFAGSAPLVLVDALTDVPDDGIDHLLNRLQRMAGAVQVVHLTDDERVVAWAERSGPDHVAVVHPVPVGTLEPVG